MRSRPIWGELATLAVLGGAVVACEADASSRREDAPPAAAAVPSSSPPYDDGPDPPAQASPATGTLLHHLAMPSLSPRLALAKSTSGRTAEIRVETGGEPYVLVDGQRVTDKGALRFDPAIDEAHAAFAETVDDVKISRIVMDGTIIVDDGSLHAHLAMANGALHWTSAAIPTNGAGEYAYCRRAHDDGNVRCEPLSFVPGALDIGDDGAVVVSGFDPASARFVVRHMPVAGAPHDESSPHPLVLVRRGGSLLVAEVSGPPGLLPLFFAYERLAGQLGEPYTFGGDGMGRLAWNVSYRLRALGELYRKTGDERLRFASVALARELALRLDADGRASSTKYSLDDATPIYLGIDQAMIHQAILSVADLMSAAERASAIARARRAVDAYENDWVVDHYRQTPCIPIAYDGVALPFNQQNALGLVLLAIDGLTGEPQHRARIVTLYDNLVAELAPQDGLLVWHYQPASFYAGWTAGQTPSCNSPARAASTDRYFSDTRHAAIDAEFLLEVSTLLGVPMPVDLDAIAARVEATPNVFSRFVAGDTGTYPGSWRHLPPLVASERTALHYQTEVVVPFADFDEQWRMLSFARALQPAIAGTVHVTLARASDGPLVPVDAIDLDAEAMLDFWIAIGRENKGL